MIPFNEEHDTIREMVSSFAQNELLPRAEQTDETCAFPADKIRELAELGLLGAALPEAHGGADGDTLTALLIALELGSGCPSTAMPIAAHSIGATLTVLDHGTDSQKQDLLPQLASGSLLATTAVYESNTDPSAPAVAARRDGDSWVLHGIKTQVVAAEHAGLFLVTASVDGGERGVFLVRSGDPGVTTSTDGAVLGLRGAGLGTLGLEACRVDADAVLGGAPSSAACQRLMDFGHLSAAAITLGIARSAWRFALEYSRERTAFGGPIHRFEVLRRYLAEAATSCEGAELLVYRAAAMRDRGEDLKHAPSMAKMAACDAAYRTTKNAVQTLGGNGYSREYPVERWYRDAKILEELESSTQVNAQHIAMSLIGEGA